MTIRVMDLELLQENVMNLVNYAEQNGGLRLNGESGSFVEIFTKAANGNLTRSELEDLVSGVQSFVRLPVYTTTQAAAWLGVGIDTIRDAVWRTGKIKTMKPGHDVLVPHEELVNYLQEMT